MVQYTKNPTPGLPQGLVSASVQDAGNIATTQVYVVVQFGAGPPSGSSSDTSLYIDTTATTGSPFYHSPGGGSGYTNLP